jgi:tetratricopeptide (TPR) repeat protein
MKGQLAEQPLAELIREISLKSMSGRLRLEHDRAQVVVYFDRGNFLYAASNLRTLRLREYLKKSAAVSERDLAQFNERVSDADLVRVLCAQNLLSAEAAEQAQTRQVADVLRLALLWTEGPWEFDSRSRLEEQFNLKIDLGQLLVEAASRVPVEVEPVAPPPEPAHEVDLQEAEAFLRRVKSAPTYYDVLDVGRDVSPTDLKTVYYQLARRYHPDRFRKTEPALVPRFEGAFARLTQAYDTLRDDRLRAGYDAKLAARKKVEEAAPAPVNPVERSEPAATRVDEPVVSAVERAEAQFKEGLAALELGQRKVALGLFASAASARPKEARYRAHYGQMLAENERTRRAAEGEFQAAIKLDPANGEYRVMLAELYRDLGLKLRAKGEAERAVAADPNNRKARELLRALK